MYFWLYLPHNFNLKVNYYIQLKIRNIKGIEL